jgi:hypothetical protein
MQSEMHGVMSGRCCSVLTGPGGSLLSVTRLDPGWRSGVGTRPMRSLGRPCPCPRPAPYWCDALARSMAQCSPMRLGTASQGACMHTCAANPTEP